MNIPRFKTKAGKFSTELKDIVFLSAMGNYTVFHLESGEEVTTSLPLCTYEPLFENVGFMRIHKSTLFNLHFLDRCTMGQTQTLTLPTGQIIDIARRRFPAVKKIIKAYKEAAKEKLRSK